MKNLEHKDLEIIVLTTKGCAACDIAIQNAKNAISKCPDLSIELSIKSKEDVGRRYLSYYGITDFPAILFSVNSRVKYIAVGSKHENMIVRWIDIYFKGV